jgi:PKD repeat protein
MFKIRFCLIFLLINIKLLVAQCPLVYNYLGNLSSRPYFVNCQGTGTYNMNFSSNQNWGAYTIKWGDGSSDFAGAAYVANTIISHTYLSAIPDTFEIKLIIPSSSCTLTGVVVMEKQVNASIQIPIGGITSACAPQILVFSNSSTEASKTTSFTWDFGDGTPLEKYDYNNAGNTVSHLYNKGTVSCQTTVRLVAKNYCTPIPTIANFNPLNIYDLDIANISTPSLFKCWPNNSFVFSNTTNRNCVPQGNTFQRQERWNFGDYWGLGRDSIINWKPWPPTSPLTIAYPSTGSYIVRLQDSNLCGVATRTISINVINPPNASLASPSGPFCQNTPITFTNTSDVGPGYLYEWNFGTGGGYVSKPFGVQTFTYNPLGTFTVSVVASISGGGPACSDTDRVAITILPQPTSNFATSQNIGCDSIIGVNFTDFSISALSWNWDFGNSNTFNGPNPPPQNFRTIGTAIASLTVTSANTCNHTFTSSITVNKTPVATFSVSNSCVDSPTNFTDMSTFQVGDNILSWNWNFGDGSPTNTSTLKNPVHTYTVSGTYSVQLIVNTATCTHSITQTIFVNIKPTADFSYNPLLGCPSLTVNFTNTSINATSYSWNFGNGNSASLINPSEVFTNSLTVPKEYAITLTASTTAGCTDNKTYSVTVFGRPSALFNLNTVNGCSPIVSTFTNTSIGATNYTWDFGDNSLSTSTLSVLSHTYINSSLFLKTYNIKLLAIGSGGCKDSSYKTLSVFPIPSFNFTVTTIEACSPLNVNFNSVLGAISHTWNFGDGSPLNNTPSPNHIFTNTNSNDVTYTVSLKVSNAFLCVDSAIYNKYKIHPIPTADFVATPTTGCSPLLCSFTNTSFSNTSLNYLWKFGDGNTSNNINATHTYSNSTNSNNNQTFTCTLVSTNSTNGCKDSLSKTLTLLFKPKANFVVDTPGCYSKVLNFTNKSIGADSYKWQIGSNTFTNVNISQPFINNTSNNITNNVKLIANGLQNCSDTIDVSIIVYPKPSFFIKALPDSGCTNLNVNFEGAPNITSYKWNFNDGNISSDSNPVHTYYNYSQVIKTFTVELIGSNNYGCYDTVVKMIKVLPKPVAQFEVKTKIVYGETTPIVCDNLSSGGVDYYWDFGDNSNSSLFKPTHTYREVGEYQIYLIATNSYGCKDSFNLGTKITSLVEADIEAPNAFSPSTTGSKGGSFNLNDLDNDIFHPIVRGVDKYELNIFSRWGLLLFVSDDINIGWDGYYKGTLCDEDIYIWNIKATTLDGRKLNKTGDVFLFK